MIINRKKAISILCITSLLTLGGCLQRTLASRIVLINQSSNTISTVSVEVNKEIFDAHEIKPGQSHTWQFNPSKDGSFTFTGRLSNGVPVKGNSLGYTTNGDTSEHLFIVQRDGSVVVSSDGKK